MTSARIDNPQALGAAVRNRRRDLGLTQEEVAGVARTGARFVGELEAGKPTVQLAEMLRVLGALGLDLELNDR
jgi:y4mF family transcriptional regulator